MNEVRTIREALTLLRQGHRVSVYELRTIASIGDRRMSLRVLESLEERGDIEWNFGREKVGNRWFYRTAAKVRS